MAKQSKSQRSESFQSRPLVESMESRTMMSVSSGYTETLYAGGGKAVRWVSAMDFTPDGRLLIASQYDSRYSGGVLWIAKGGKVSRPPS